MTLIRNSICGNMGSHYFWCRLDLSYSSGTAPVCLEVRWLCSNHWPCSSYGFSALFVKWGVSLQHTDVKLELSTGNVPRVGCEISAWIPVPAENQIFLLWEINCCHFGRILMKEPNPRLFKRGLSLQPENHRVSCLSWQWAHLNKESACNAGDSGSIPGLGRFPWRRARQPTPVFLPGESLGQKQ